MSAARWTIRIAVAAVVVASAVSSYWNLYELAHRAGEPFAWLLPLSVDGVIVASSMTLLVARRAGRPGEDLAWVGMWCGVGVSLCASLAFAAPTMGSFFMAVWPPLALPVAFALLLRLGGATPGPGSRGPE